MNLRNPLYLFLILILCTALLAIGTIHKDLYEWDESRNGINAYEMLQKGDYINLYYGNEIDTWNAKPPLMAWFIISSYKIAGFNEFALRLPAAICTLLFFLCFFKTVKLSEGGLTAFLSCLILLSCKGIIGFHGGINGDFDAMLLLFLMLSAYYFIRFIELKEQYAIYLVAICTGFAFYTKGTAGLLFLPGFILYAILKGEFKPILKNSHTWMAAGTFIGIVTSWIIIVLIYSKTPSQSVYGSKNPIETMLVHDTFRRLTSSHFDNTNVRNYLFFVSAADVRFNLWNYLFYASAITGLFLLYKNRKAFWQYIRKDTNRLTVFSICVAAPVIITLNFAVNMHDWYFMPVWGFLAFITVKGLHYFVKKKKTASYIFAAVFLFTCTRHFIYLSLLPEEKHRVFTRSNPVFAKEDYIVLTDNPKQNLLLYLHWMDIGFVKMVNSGEELTAHKNKALIIQKDDIAKYPFSNNIQLIQFTDEYCIARIK